MKQECIPVGCVPAAHWPFAGVCLVWGGLVWSQGSVFLVRGVWSWGVLPARGLCLVWGGSPCPETPTVNRITHTCKNITLATTSLRPVIISANKNVPVLFCIACSGLKSVTELSTISWEREMVRLKSVTELSTISWEKEMVHECRYLTPGVPGLQLTHLD